MKNKVKDLVLFTIIFVYFVYCLLNNSIIKEQVLYSFNLWITKVVPALFPIFIIVDLLYSSRVPFFIQKYLGFNCIYILSIISGSPSNAYILSKYNDDITKHLSVTKYTSPIFTYTYLKTIFNTKLAVFIMFANILSNCILFLLIKPKKLRYIQDCHENVFLLLSNSIKKNINNLVTILGTIIFFNTLPITLLDDGILKSFLLSVLEITTSFDNLVKTDIPNNMKLFFTIISISTCGLCIETQIKSIANDTFVNNKSYWCYRLLHLIIFLLIIYISLLFFN